MNVIEYQREALRTETGMNKDPSTLTPEKFRLLNGLAGLCGEAGEAMDIFKKHIFHGHDLDIHHLALELGDVAWYLAVAADAIGYDLEKILVMNRAKLRARYPDGFDPELSKNRKEGDI